MRQELVQVELEDKKVWVRGQNGVNCVKWMSKIQLRTDLEILGDYVDGQQEPVVYVKKEETPAPKKKVAPKKKATGPKMMVGNGPIDIEE